MRLRQRDRIRQGMGREIDMEALRIGRPKLHADDVARDEIMHEGEPMPFRDQAGREALHVGIVPLAITAGDL
ncbi:hypothetical protein K32_30010 [Kaistia sp. 32K]|nr:hypothetical protein K32_30010 [Kaistia sp. 32K]